MRAVSVFPLDEFRLALKKVYGAAAPKGPFTALSQATLFFSRNSCTIACCNLNQWCQATIPAQGDEFSLTLYDTQRLLDACAYFSGELHLEYETAEKKPHNCDIPYNQARFSCGGREIHQLVSTAISIRAERVSTGAGLSDQRWNCFRPLHTGPARCFLGHKPPLELLRTIYGSQDVRAGRI